MNIRIKSSVRIARENWSSCLRGTSTYLPGISTLELELASIIHYLHFIRKILS